MRNSVLLLSFLLFLAACQSSRHTSGAAKTAAPPAEETVTATETAPAANPVQGHVANPYRYHFLKGYKASATRQFDLLHTELHVSFDWEKREMPGRALLTLTPYFYPQRVLTLDAKAFALHRVALIEEGSLRTPDYSYDSLKLKIQLPRTYEKGDTLQVLIEYTARPEKSRQRGSRAISKGQGLYFINADGSDPKKPRQIWTQGEPESNSNWFPTIDKPNERTTQSMYITVADSFTTLSNGLLIESTDNGDGTRTDHWEMELPHAPYLFMMAIGPFTVTRDEWRGRPVNYYMEPAYAANARRIFGRTPEMMETFSRLLGVDFPWPKYSQVAVRDFVSGAMENTTATIHYSALNATREVLVDRDFDDIISHELFHQWFGDYVTCESWANLPLNESFATYGEILWHEHRGGSDEADRQRLNDLKLYLMMGRQQAVPMIRYYHKSPGEMFDANSYQRGAATLGMLRQYTGDEAFFKALKLYLTRHRFQAVEIHNLRLAFEEVTGEDLNWFFDEWMMTAGVIEVQMDVTYDPAKDETVLSVAQKNAGEPALFYRLPLDVAKYREGKKSVSRVWLTGADSTYVFPGSFDALIPDERGFMVAIVKRSFPESYIYEIRKPEMPFYMRNLAIDSLEIHQERSLKAYGALRSLLQDSFAPIREKAIEKWEPAAADFHLLRDLALNDPAPAVRAAAVNKIYAVSDSADFDVFSLAVKDSSIKVAGEALYVLYETNREEAAKYTAKFEESNSPNLVTTIAEIYAKDAGAEKQYFFREALKKDIGWSRFVVMNRYAQFLGRMEDPGVIRQGIADFRELCEGSNSNMAYIAFRSIKRVKSALLARSQALISEEEKSKLDTLINEMDAVLKEIYEGSSNKMIKKSGLD